MSEKRGMFYFLGGPGCVHPGTCAWFAEHRGGFKCERAAHLPEKAGEEPVRHDSDYERGRCIFDGCTEDAKLKYAVCYNHRQQAAGEPASAPPAPAEPKSAEEFVRVREQWVKNCRCGMGFLGQHQHYHQFVYPDAPAPAEPPVAPTQEGKWGPHTATGRLSKTLIESGLPIGESDEETILVHLRQAYAAGQQSERDRSRKLEREAAIATANEVVDGASFLTPDSGEAKRARAIRNFLFRFIDRRYPDGSEEPSRTDDPKEGR